MADGLTFEVKSDALLAAIGNALARVDQPRALMQNIGAALLMNMKNRFSDRVDPDGHAWLPLSPKTIAMKAKAGKSTLLMLYNSGEMQDSLTYNAGNDWVEVGTAMPYGAYHETGTRRMPRRSFLMGDFNAGRLGEVDQGDVLHVIETFLANGLGPL